MQIRFARCYSANMRLCHSNSPPLLRRCGRNLLIGFLFLIAACSHSEQEALRLASQAQAEAEAGDLVAARRTIAKAISERDDIADIYLLKGHLDLKAKSYLEAYDAFSQVLTLDATNPQALQAVTQLALGLGRVKEAGEAADRVLALDPTQGDALFVKGLVHLSNRRPAPADEVAEALLKGAPNDERGLVLKARVLYFENRTAEAIALLETHSQAATRSDLVSRTLVELYREDGRAVDILAELDRYNARTPDQPNGRIDAANILYKTGRKEEARRLLIGVLGARSVAPKVVDKILPLWYAYDDDPLSDSEARLIRDGGTRLGVSRFYLLEGRPDRAMSALDGLSSSESEALRVRIAMQQKPSAALAARADSILLGDATQCDALVARSLYRRATGLNADGVSDARHAVGECPGDAGAVLSAAAALRANNDQAGEFRTFDNALDRDPQNLAIARTYFRRTLEVGSLGRATAVARRVTRAAPSSPPGWALLAQACALARDATCAATARSGLDKATKSLALDPRPGDITAGGPLNKLSR